MRTRKPSSPVPRQARAEWRRPARKVSFIDLSTHFVHVPVQNICSAGASTYARRACRLISKNAIVPVHKVWLQDNTVQHNGTSRRRHKLIDLYIICEWGHGGCLKLAHPITLVWRDIMIDSCVLNYVSKTTAASIVLFERSQGTRRSCKRHNSPSWTKSIPLCHPNHHDTTHVCGSVQLV